VEVKVNVFPMRLESPNSVGNGTLEQLPQLMSNMGKNVFLTTAKAQNKEAYWTTSWNC